MVITRGWLPVASSLPLAMFAAVACGSNSTPIPPEGADASVAAEAGADTSEPEPDAGDQCNAVVNGASTVFESVGSGTKPAPAGGVIADGTYFLTKDDVYPPGVVDSTARRRTIVFSGNTWETHENDPGRGTSQGSGTFTTSGTTITFTATCFGGSQIIASNSTSYSATEATFTTFAKDADGDVFTNTKQ